MILGLSNEDAGHRVASILEQMTAEEKIDLIAGFDLNVLACDACGGRLRLVATIAEPGLVRQILSHLGLPTEIPQAAPAQPRTWLPGIVPQDDWVKEVAAHLGKHRGSSR